MKKYGNLIPILVTPEGMFILCNEIQPKNAVFPILVMVVGNVTFVNEVQSLNVSVPK